MEQRPAVVITILEQSLVITAGKFRNPAPEVLEIFAQDLKIKSSRRK